MIVIEPNQIESALPVAFPPCKEETLHFFAACRKLKPVRAYDSYQLQRTNESLDSLRDALALSTLHANTTTDKLNHTNPTVRRLLSFLHTEFISSHAFDLV